MKKTFKSIALIAITILATSSVFAQKTEATVVYDMKMESDNEMVQQQLAMMQGSTMTMMFKDENFKQTMNMGGMQKTTTIVNGKTDKSLMLMEVMGMKWAIDMPADKKDDVKDDEVKPTVEVTDEKKEIAGYACKKVIVSSEVEDEEMEMVLWVTTELKPNNNKNQYGSDKVDGFPLSMEIETNRGGMPMTMTMTATSVETKVKDKKAFSTDVPEGYEKKTMEDLKAMGGGL